jgi:hypothetical protein
MEIALIKKSSRTKLSTSNPQQPINSKNTEKPKPQKNQYREAGSKKETHLTVIGVCTTIRPENSGT